MQKTLKEIAALVGGELSGDIDGVVTGVTNIEHAGPRDITFAVPPHLDEAAVCRAAAVLIPADAADFAKPAIRVQNPRLAFTKLLELFTPPAAVERGVHPTAVLGRDVTLGENVAIMPYAVLADGVKIGANTVIYPHTFIGAGTTIGADAIIYPNVTVREHCRIGDRVIIHANAAIGSDGFGFVPDGGRHQKVPQVGDVILGDDVEIGSHVGVDRATTGSTIVMRGTKIDNLVHVAHNVVIGENCFVVALTGISGSVKIGNHVTLAGQCGANGHITIGDHCVFAARSGIISDVPANSFYAGFPARPHQEWLRGQAGIYKIGDLLKKVRQLEKRLSQLEGRS